MKLPTVNLNRYYALTKHTVMANRTHIYATVASIGVVATGYFSAKAAIKSKEYFEEHGDATLKEKIIWNGRVWLLPVVIGGVTIFCIWRGHKIHLDKEASLAAMGAYWKRKHDDLEKKVKEKLGEEGAEELKEEILNEKMESKADFPTEKPPEGMFWVYDEITDQFFKTSSDRITWALYTANKRFVEEKDVSYNYILTLMGGNPSDLIKSAGWTSWDPDLLDEMNWNQSDGIARWIDITPSKKVHIGPNGVEAHVLEFMYEPRDMDAYSRY